jgi:ketosteroid isomerase-like protein
MPVPTALESTAIQSVEAFNRGGIEAMLEYHGEDLVWYAAPGWPGQDVYRGHHGARALAREWTESFDEYHWDLHEAAERNGRVLILGTHRGRSRDGVWVDQPAAAVSDVGPDGRLTVTRFFFDWDEARAALE